MAVQHIDVTWTRKGTWFITAPCGWHVELPGECLSEDIRTMAWRHKTNCCHRARLSVETATGYRESDKRKDTAA